MASLADLETYATNTCSPLFGLAAQILSGSAAEAVTGPAGIAHAMAGLIRAFPLHSARRQLFLPADLLARHQAHPHDIFAGRPSAGLAAALAELRDLAGRRLDAARENLMALPQAAVPALLPIALVRPSLDRLARSDPFAPRELPLWRRQWLIWRAARNPTRIAA
jgi:phytoene synthase